MQLLTFHIGLMSREMTTYEFIMAQRQRQKEFDQVHGKASLSRKQRQQRWVENNAPCLAVCVVCDDSPAKGASSAKAQAAAVKVTIGSEQRGRAFPRFLSWGSSSPQNVANGMAQPSAPMDERAPCASESDLPHTRVVAAQALPEPQGVVEEAPGQNENQDSNAHAELSSVHIAAASAVQEGYLEATAMQSLAQDAAVFLLLVQAPIRRELTFHAGENLCLRRLVRRRQCQVRYTNQMQCHPLVKAQGKRHRCLDSQTATFRGQLGLLPMCVCAMPIFCESGVPSVDPDTAAAIPQRRPVALRSTCMCW
eukprot:CAMPEP_0181185068 /NCGR_PEP_ID=MMETSP1096-20121128/9308_1 /TAXON_ID=156174 ORGANISM="Chrysochromulina ericina, Strain CCMP281" /NCGR_SAMPLE_ID=MMETSP1096 /ASSEMBLY_ACC=CAM_ASM_000453 /LENGTH=308 /DNA_ID=CAMNT_0023273883 /DNA_START=326 /DNA_END=1250 /DNA_ORIENTATION=+